MPFQLRNEKVVRLCTHSITFIGHLKIRPLSEFYRTSFFPLVVLEYEKLYLENLPDAECYEKSYMHRDVITHVVVSKTDFVVTASIDGHLKFWKKMEDGIEFVKHFRSHLCKWKSSHLNPSVVTNWSHFNFNFNRYHQCTGCKCKWNIPLHRFIW